MFPKTLRAILALVVVWASLILPSAQAAPAQAKGDFVQVQNGQLVFGGKPVKLKGTNFYPKDQPWADMWGQWNGDAARQDLSRARELGINTVRILVPYKPANGWTDLNTGQVNPIFLGELRQMVQIAGDMNLKVIIALFDFYDPTDDNGTTAQANEARNKQYLQTIIPTFANDDRVLAWDLHNEPDQYNTWNDFRRPDIEIKWLTDMAAEVRRLDPNHLLTVGVSQFDNLFVSDGKGAPALGAKPSGPTLADLSDFLSFHSYNAGNMDWQIAYIKDHSNKPIVLQETGWPSGPPCQQPDYSESQQVTLYNLVLQAARKADLAGVLQWQLWDLPPGASGGGGRETGDDYFGLLRRDGTWKAAMPLFRDGWPGSGASAGADPLPSVTTSQLPYTVRPPKPVPTDPNYQPPYYFPETGHYIWNTFRDYWKHFGGLPVFGYPITEQRKEGDYWVQYFERARFEYHPENQRKVPNWDQLDKNAKLSFLIQLTRLGADRVDQATGAKGFPKIDPSQVAAGATYFPETGHSISGKVGDYWKTHNGITNFGYPLSEAFQEVSQTNGKTYLVQYFERTRLEYHPENAGSPYEILLGLMGRELLASKGCK